MRNKLNERERKKAKQIAKDAIIADSQGNSVVAAQAISELWGIVGYWKRTNRPSVAEFRGEIIPPKMFRMPNGVSVGWRQRWRAVEAWAGFGGD